MSSIGFGWKHGMKPRVVGFSGHPERGMLWCGKCLLFVRIRPVFDIESGELCDGCEKCGDPL